MALSRPALILDVTLAPDLTSSVSGNRVPPLMEAVVAWNPLLSLQSLLIMTHPRWAPPAPPPVPADTLVPVAPEIGTFPVAAISAITAPPDLKENPPHRGWRTFPVVRLVCKSRLGDKGIAFTTYAVTISRTTLLNGHGQILSPNPLSSRLITQFFL